MLRAGTCSLSNIKTKEDHDAYLLAFKLSSGIEKVIALPVNDEELIFTVINDVKLNEYTLH